MSRDKGSRSNVGRRGTAGRVAVESLEGRQLLSVTVPNGYVKVGTATVNSNGTVATAAAVAGGTVTAAAGDEFLFATDSVVYLDNGSPRRQVDAEFGQRQSDRQWVTASPNSGFDWGLGAGTGSAGPANNLSFTGATPNGGDHGQTAPYTAAAAGDVKLKFFDDNYGDNAGTFSVDVYRKVVLRSLTVADNAADDWAATATDASPASLFVATDTGGNASVHISGLAAPDVAAAYNKILYRATADASGATVAEGVLGQVGVDQTFTSGDFTVVAGVDLNGDNVLGFGEVTRTVAVEAQPVKLKANPAALTVTRPAAGQTAESSASSVTIVTNDANEQFKGLPRRFGGTVKNAQGQAVGGCTINTARVQGGPNGFTVQLTVTIPDTVAAGPYTVTVQDVTFRNVAPVDVTLTVQP